MLLPLLHTWPGIEVTDQLWFLESERQIQSVLYWKHYKIPIYKNLIFLIVAWRWKIGQFGFLFAVKTSYEIMKLKAKRKRKPIRWWAVGEQEASLSRGIHHIRKHSYMSTAWVASNGNITQQCLLRIMCLNIRCDRTLSSLTASVRVWREFVLLLQPINEFHL